MAGCDPGENCRTPRGLVLYDRPRLHFGEHPLPSSAHAIVEDANGVDQVVHLLRLGHPIEFLGREEPEIRTVHTLTFTIISCGMRYCLQPRPGRSIGFC